MLRCRLPRLGTILRFGLCGLFHLSLWCPCAMALQNEKVPYFGSVLLACRLVAGGFEPGPTEDLPNRSLRRVTRLRETASILADS